MMQGKIEAVSIKPFITKAGASMFKIGIKIEGTFYNTVSKFAEQKFKKGDEVFFETQDQWPDSIIMGTLKIINGSFTPKTTATWKDVELPHVYEAKAAKKKIAELERKLKEYEDEALLKELDDPFNDDIPF